MYSVTIYASWDALHNKRVRLHGTYSLRGAAMEAAQAHGNPIVDVRDIGEAGRCPARPHEADGTPRGHRFAGGTAGGTWACGDCAAPQADLYVGTTVNPRPPDNALIDGPYYVDPGAEPRRYAVIAD